MKRAIYPGSFDPITNGHLDVLRRALELFDEVVVGIASNQSKRPFFDMLERKTLAEEVLKELGLKAQVVIFNGLLIDFARAEKACAIVRGLRAISDFEFEFQMALMNRKLADSVETIFLMPKDTYTYLSSSIIKEIGRLGGDISAFVPRPVEKALKQKASMSHGG